MPELVKKTLIVLPTYNEKQNLPKVTKLILQQDSNLEILVIDDNSPDGTGRLADTLASQDNRIHVIHRPGKLGLGTAYIAGFKYALEYQYDYVFEMDADLSHPPGYIKRILRKIESGYDLVVGSRYTQGISVVNWDLKRLALSLWASLYARKITGVKLTDPMAGFKCFRREVLEKLPLDKIHSNGYSFQIEMHFRAHRAGFKIGEIPIVFIERKKGNSKMSRKVILEAALMPWRLRLNMYDQ